MSTRIGTDSTREWRVQYLLGPGRYENYTMSAHNAEVTNGGVLIFRDLHGTVTQAISPSGWDQVEPA